MTDDQMQNVREDIAYMRAMAHEGRHAPLLAGPVLVAASLIFGAANLAQWAIDAGVVQVSDWAMLGVWIGAGVIFSACLVWLIGRMKRRPGFNSSGNRAVGAAWSAVGWGIFATWLGLLAMALKSGDGSSMMAMPTVVMVAYGSAWMVASAMTCSGWMRAVGVVSYVGAVALGWFVDGPLVYLVFTVLLIAVALIPGLILMRQEPSEVI